MLDFIKESLKNNNLYINTKTVNNVIDEFKNTILENKEEFEKILKLDLETSKGKISINKIIEILDMYKDSKFSENSKKDLAFSIYYGNPYITINLCMQSLICKKSIILSIEDCMLGINKLIVETFNKILEEFKFANLVKLVNNASIEEIINVSKYVNKVICIGNSGKYYELKNKIENLKYIDFKNIVIFSKEEKFEEIKFEIYKFCVDNFIECEVYEDLEEFIDCVNVIKLPQNVIVLSENKEIIKKIEAEIENKKLFVNKNPFKNETFKIDIL